jgi:hypothetical protein
MSPVEEAVETEVPLTPEQVAQAEAAEDAEMTEGFQAATPTEIPSLVPTTPHATVTPTEPPPETTPPPEPPKLAEITEEQFTNLLNAAKEVDNLKDALHRQMGGVHGKMGGLEKMLKDMQAATPAGQSLEVTSAHFEEMTKEFPDLVDMTVKGLNRALKTVRGTAPPVVDFDAKVNEGIKAALPDVVRTVKQETTLELMTTLLPDWETTVHSPEYLAWLTTQPQAYQDTINNSWKIPEVKGSIEKFTTFHAEQAASTKPKPTTPTEKPKSRLAAAVTPKSAGGGTGPTVTTEEDAMHLGYKQASNA